jgi:hypothetical protein
MSAFVPVMAILSAGYRLSYVKSAHGVDLPSNYHKGLNAIHRSELLKSDGTFLLP